MRVALIDLSGVFRMHWHAGEQGEVNEARRKTIHAVHSYVADYDGVGVCIDMPPYKRKDIDPNYKAHRDKAPAVMHEEMAQTIETLRDEGYHVFGTKGFEADDIIATLCEWTEQQGHECTIYSSDKDICQLVSPLTSVISTATREKYDADGVKAKFGVGPELVHDLLTLTGDKSDNIPGIRGCGMKKAAAWLNEHGSLEGVLLNADKIPGKVPSGPPFAEVLKESSDLLGKSAMLTSLLRNAPINPEELTKPMQPKPKQEEIKYAELDEPDTATETAAESLPQPETLPPPEKPSEEPKQAMVEYQPTSWDKSLEPRDPRQAWGVARMLHQSKLFGDFPNAEAILAILMTGRSFGMDATSSLRGFHVIKGKVSPSSQLLIGLVKRHPCCLYFRFVDGDEKSATWETKRKGEPEPTRITYTIEDANLAGLANNDNWRKRPKTMLRWRAGVELARLVYSDVVSGLYTDDEVSEFDG